MSETEKKVEIKKETLIAPTGVFATQDGIMLVVDTWPEAADNVDDNHVLFYKDKDDDYITLVFLGCFKVKIDKDILFTRFSNTGRVRFCRQLPSHDGAIEVSTLTFDKKSIGEALQFKDAVKAAKPTISKA